MKPIKSLFIIAVLFHICSCGTTKSVTDGQQDGSSFEKAVFVNSIPEEYQHVKKVCPDCQFVLQSLVFHKNKPFDVLEYKKPNGESVSYYFNISKFYGKGF